MAPKSLAAFKYLVENGHSYEGKHSELKEALNKWIPFMPLRQAQESVRQTCPEPFDKLRTGLSKDLIRASLLTRPINIGRVNPGQGCPGAATSRVSPGRACTGLGGGPKYQEGIYGPD